MDIIVYNPENKKQSARLSQEQFEVVHAYVVACMNLRRGIDEELVVEMCRVSGHVVHWT